MDNLKQKLKQIQDQLQKQIRSNFLITLEKLEELILEKKISGYYGLLIEHLQINPQFLFAYDIACKGKLFSVIVDNENTAFQIVEIIKSLKGSNITIYPLSWLNQQDDIEEARVKIKEKNYIGLYNSKLIKIKDDKFKSLDVLLN